jgi:hypothetical protein
VCANHGYLVTCLIVFYEILVLEWNSMLCPLIRKLIFFDNVMRLNTNIDSFNLRFLLILWKLRFQLFLIMLELSLRYVTTPSFKAIEDHYFKKNKFQYFKAIEDFYWLIMLSLTCSAVAIKITIIVIIFLKKGVEIYQNQKERSVLVRGGG